MRLRLTLDIHRHTCTRPNADDTEPEQADLASDTERVIGFGPNQPEEETP